MNYKFLFFIAILFFYNCKNERKTPVSEKIEAKSKLLKYAKGFSVEDYGDYKILEIKNPWPKAEKSYKYLLLGNKKSPLPQGEFDATIEIPIKKIVVTSTTHIPALELLNVEQTLVGFPELIIFLLKKQENGLKKAWLGNLVKTKALTPKFC